MKVSESFHSLENGACITIYDDLRPITFLLNIGDARLNGDPDQVWLENTDFGKRRYLRRMPENNMSIGPALFSSLSELVQTLENGDFYIA